MIVKVRQPPARKSLEELRRQFPAICFSTAASFRLNHDPGLDKPVTCRRCGAPTE